MSDEQSTNPVGYITIVRDADCLLWMFVCFWNPDNGNLEEKAQRNPINKPNILKKTQQKWGEGKKLLTQTAFRKPA